MHLDANTGNKIVQDALKGFVNKLRIVKYISSRERLLQNSEDNTHLKVATINGPDDVVLRCVPLDRLSFVVRVVQEDAESIFAKLMGQFGCNRSHTENRPWVSTLSVYYPALGYGLRPDIATLTEDRISSIPGVRACVLSNIVYSDTRYIVTPEGELAVRGPEHERRYE